MASFGYSTGDTGTNRLEDRICGVWASPSNSGTATSITVKMNCSAAFSATNMTCGLYAYVDWSTDFAGALLGQTEVKSVSQADAGIWSETFTLNPSVSISSGTKYYIMASFDTTADAVVTVRKITEVGYGIYKAGYQSTLPNPLTGESSSTGKRMLYCTYTPAAPTSTEYMVDGTTTHVILNHPKRIDKATSRKIKNLIFNDNTDVQVDMGKNSDQIILTGTLLSSADADIHTLEGMMDNAEEVTVTGLPDSNMNTDYLIADLNYKRESAWVSRYDYSLVLERLHDQLG